MKRRTVLIAAGSSISVALAGCASSNTNQNETTDQDFSADVVFTVEKEDLVVKHESGDVLEAGETVSVTIDGEPVKEKTLSETVYSGGEIIRVSNVTEEYVGERRVALYLHGSDSLSEIGSETIKVIVRYSHHTPNTKIAFDYTATNSSLGIYHDGGESFNADNTGEIRIRDESGSELGNSPVSDFSYVPGDSIDTGIDVSSTNSVEVIWVAPDGGRTQVIGSWEKP